MGRPAGFKHNQKARDAIRTTHLVRRLDLFQEGKIELTSGQVKAIEILLAKSLPNLTHTEHAGEINNPAANLYEQVAGETASKADRGSDSDSIH